LKAPALFLKLSQFKICVFFNIFFNFDGMESSQDPTGAQEKSLGSYPPVPMVDPYVPGCVEIHICPSSPTFVPW
jgi:hypothetical protein